MNNGRLNDLAGIDSARSSCGKFYTDAIRCAGAAVRKSRSESGGGSGAHSKERSS
jgi:hypothetical protein